MTSEPPPFVSVIIPAYNAATTIGKCLDALQHQTYPRERYEVIVVDDGSRDATAAVVQGYGVSYLYQRNTGPATARNRGAQAARGGIILFTDADCVPALDWLEEMAAALKPAEVAAVKGVYRNGGKSLWTRFAQIEFLERYRLLARHAAIDMIDTYAAGFKKDIFLAFGGFDTSFPVPNNEDTDLSYRMSRKGCKMVFNPNAIVWHLGHPDTMQKYARTKFLRGYWRMVVYEKHASKMIKDSYTPQTLKLQILLALLALCSLLLAPLSPGPMFGATLLFLAAFLGASAPFMALAFRQDRAVGLLSPFFLLVRAEAIGLGALSRIAEVGWGRFTGRLLKKCC